MQSLEFEQLTIDELWALHEEISEVLAARLAAEKRRPYPPVRPKFRNPDNPAETWAGRGRQPRWVAEQLRLGRRMEELKI
jgi:DNA-binding protein H-NS